MRFIALFLLSLVFLFPSEASAAESVKDWGLSTVENPMKEWTLTFQSEVNSSAFEHIYVLDEKSNVKPMTKTLNATKTAVILKPVTPYEEGQIYTLKIDKQLKSADGVRLSAGNEKRFYIPSTKKSEIVYNDAVKHTNDFKYVGINEANGKTTYTFTYAGNKTYEVNDLIIANEASNFENGFAGQIKSIHFENGKQIITMESVGFEEVIDSFSIHDESYLTEDQLREIMIAGVNPELYMVRNTALSIPLDALKLSPKITGKIKGYDATAELVFALKDFKVNIDLEYNKLLNVKEFRTTISGKQSIEKVVKFGLVETLTPPDRPSLKNKNKLTDFEYTVGKVPITLSIPTVSAFIETGLTFELGLSGGAQFATEESNEFEFGTLYKDKKFHTIANSSSESSTVSLMGFGELDAKFGIYGAIGIQALNTEVVKATLKGGPYSTFGVYNGLTAGSKVCFAVESGAFVSGEIEILPESKKKFGTEIEKKLSLVKPLECTEITNIKPTEEKISIAVGETKKIKIKKTETDLKNGSTSSSTIKAKKLKYKYDSNFVIVDEKIGAVQLTKAAPAEVPIQITYLDGSKTFTTTVKLIKAADEKTIQQALSSKKAQLKSQGMSVFETKMLNSGRQLLAVKTDYDHPSKNSFFVYVYNFDEKTNVWTKVFEEGFEYALPYKRNPISMNNNSLEQHIFYNEAGSWMGVSPMILIFGSKDGKTIETLYSLLNYNVFGTVETDKTSFTICNDGKGSKYTWNGSKFVDKSSSCSSPYDEGIDRYSFNSELIKDLDPIAFTYLKEDSLLNESFNSSNFFQSNRTT